MECHCIDLYALKVTLKFFWYPKIIDPKMKLIDEVLGNRYFTGWVPSLTHIFMNVHYQVTQLLSKTNTVHMRVTSNDENVSRRGWGDCLRG